MTAYITFEDNTGSFTLDALATTLGGTWEEQPSTSTSGIIENLDPDSEQNIRQIIEADENVTAYSLYNMNVSSSDPKRG